MKLREKIKRFWTLDVHNHEGFTLVELIIVIAILAILSSVAVVGYSSYVTKANMQADETLIAEIKNALTLAYYSGELSDSGYIILSTDGVVEFEGVSLSAVLANSFGGSWSNTMKLKYNGWTASPAFKLLKAEAAQAVANSSFVTGADPEAVLETVSSLTNAMTSALGTKDDAIAAIESNLNAESIAAIKDQFDVESLTELAELTHQKIEALSQQLLRNLAPRTVSDVLSILRSVLRFARVGGAEVPCDGSSVRIRRPPVEIRVLTQNEQDILMRHIFSNLTPRNAGLLLSLMTGLRVGEICALRWEDIELEDGMLYVRHTVQRLQNLSPDGPRTLLVENTPKTASSARAIPLPEDLVRVLKSLPGPREGYFLTGDPIRCVEPRMMQYHFNRATQICGIDHANYHALRHTFATRCVELGFDIKSLSELLGHSAVSMTLNRYVHPTMELKRAHMQRLAPVLTTGLSSNQLLQQNLSEM